jgi:hypothetical protein
MRNHQVIQNGGTTRMVSGGVCVHTPWLFRPRPTKV